MKPSAARLSAIRAVSQVLTGHAVRVSDFDHDLDAHQRAFAHQLAQGTINALPKLSALLRQLLSKPIKAKEAEVQAILLTGLYQIHSMRTPDHAAVNESVNLAKQLKKMWAIKLINGCLRTFIREQVSLTNNLSAAAAAAHPEWLYQAIQQQWPAQAAEILAANNQAGPMCLRVNQTRRTLTDYLAQLKTAGVGSSPTALAPQGIRLDHTLAVEQLPGFSSGLVSVQDEAAQLAASLLMVAPRQRVLDACAAPGGKACHLAESYPEAHIVARDINSERLLLVDDNAHRLGLPIQIEHTNQIPSEEAESFDHILADVPCSGSGVIRRHPDIKSLRLESDLAQFHQQQLQILLDLWPKLKPGGSLLYVTCSIFEQENDGTILAFLDQQNQASVDVINESWGHATQVGRQLLPNVNGSDGLFYCRLKKAGP